MKFVFNRDPTTVQRKLPEFKSQLEGAFAQPYKFNIYDTEFYSKVDGSLDFGRTRYEIKKKSILIISEKYIPNTKKDILRNKHLFFTVLVSKL